MQDPLTNQEIADIRSARLHRTMEAVAAAHPFYRRILSEADLRASDFKNIGDLEKLPLTSKQDYISDPESFRLDAEALNDGFSLEEKVIWDIAYTSGTTAGKPSPFYNTTHDIYGILDQARRCNLAEGLTPDDTIANLYPVAAFPTGAFLSVTRSGMIGGQPVVYGLTGAANSDLKVRNSTSEAIDRIETVRPTVLWGVPSFIRRFVADANAQGRDFSDVRMVVTSGEAVSQGLREELEKNLKDMGAGPVAFRARYAFTEMQGGLVQCGDNEPPQNITPDLYFLETVDPSTGERVPYGREGHLAITHLHRRGTVMLRYVVGDVVTLSLDPCPISGRRGERVVATPRRTGNLVKCRGMLVNTDVVLDYLASLDGIGDFQIEFFRDNLPGAMDDMILHLELAENNTLTQQISMDIRAAVSMRPMIKYAGRGTLYDQNKSIKLKRVIDSRPLAD